MNPKVSIIMSAYNEVDRLDKTIETVLSQTFEDFEFIIIDDNSTDSTRSIIKKYGFNDSRIILLENKNNIGLTKSLNKGIKLAKGDYIARIDAGDLWDKMKLEKQIGFLEKNKDYVICGTQALYICKDGTAIGKSWFGVDDEEIRIRFFTRQGIYLHPSIVFRNTGIYYREFFEYSQDLDLYCQLFFKGKFYCLPEPLLLCEINPSKLSVAKKYEQRQYQNIAYNLFKERLKYGKDSLDSGKIPRIIKNKIGLKLCGLAAPFYVKYMEDRISKKSPVLWLFWLVLSFAAYPPLAFDYWNKLKGVIVREK